MATKQIVCEGDSITAGFYASGPEFFWPALLADLLGADWLVTNIATSGETLTQMIAEVPTQLDPLYDADYTHNIVLLLGGANDIGFGGTSAQVISRLQTYYADASAAGWTVGCVLQTAFGSLCPPTWEIVRLEVRDAIWANPELFGDFIVDIAADPRIGTTATADGPNYHTDTLHPADGGFIAIAEDAHYAVLQFIGGGMANLILNAPQAIATFSPSGGTANWTLTSLANGAGRVSAQWDRGTGSKPGLYHLQVHTKAAAALAVGAQFFVYLLQSSASADVPGNLGTADAAVASSDKQRNLGAAPVTINADSTTNGEVQMSNSVIVEIYGRYVSLFAWNALGQALSGTAGDHYATLTPVPAEIQ